MSPATGEPSRSPSMLERARGAFQAGDYVAAEGLLSDLCEAWPKDTALARNLGLVRQILRRPGPGPTLPAPDAVSRYNAALLARSTGRLTDALQLLQPLLSPPQGAEDTLPHRAYQQAQVLWLDLLLTLGDVQGARNFIEMKRDVHVRHPHWRALEERAFAGSTSSTPHEKHDHTRGNGRGHEDEEEGASGCFLRARSALYAGDPHRALDLIELSDVEEVVWALHGNIACINVHRRKYGLCEWSLNVASAHLAGAIAAHEEHGGSGGAVSQSMRESLLTLTYHMGLISLRGGRWVGAWRRLVLCLADERFLYSPLYWLRLGEALLKRRESTDIPIAPGYPVEEVSGRGMDAASGREWAFPPDPAGAMPLAEDVRAVQALLPHLRRIQGSEAILSRLRPMTEDDAHLGPSQLTILALLCFLKAERLHQEIPGPSPLIEPYLYTSISRSLYLLALTALLEGEVSSPDDPLVQGYLGQAHNNAIAGHESLPPVSDGDGGVSAGNGGPSSSSSSSSSSTTLPIQRLRWSLSSTLASAFQLLNRPQDALDILHEATPTSDTPLPPPSARTTSLSPTADALDDPLGLRTDHLWWSISVHSLIGLPPGDASHMAAVARLRETARSLCPEQRGLLTPWISLIASSSVALASGH